ncbi:MAG: 2-keto-4-pentenoate hydratase [Gammaproteobacteria bacterium]
MRLFILWVFLGLATSVAHAWSTLEDWALVVATQLKARDPLPVLSHYGASLSLPEAYDVQRRVVRLIAGDDPPIAGYKASLTRPRGQVAFDVREPITGVILKPGILRGPQTLRMRDFKQLTIAPGLAFVLKSAITKPLTDMGELQAAVGTAMPAIDLSDYRFETAEGLRATDLVAANTGFARVLLGRPLPAADPATVNALLVELEYNDTVVDRGRAVNVMGNQYTALYWLVNQVLRQGGALPAGTLLVTGGFSDPVPARLGSYVAKYWDMMNLEFTLEH